MEPWGLPLHPHCAAGSIPLLPRSRQHYTHLPYFLAFLPTVGIQWWPFHFIVARAMATKWYIHARTGVESEHLDHDAPPLTAYGCCNPTLCPLVLLRLAHPCHCRYLYGDAQYTLGCNSGHLPTHLTHAWAD